MIGLVVYLFFEPILGPIFGPTFGLVVRVCGLGLSVGLARSAALSPHAHTRPSGAARAGTTRTRTSAPKAPRKTSPPPSPSSPETWTLAAAAKPYRGVTLRTIGESSAPPRGHGQDDWQIQGADRHRRQDRDVRALRGGQQGHARPQFQARALRLHPPAPPRAGPLREEGQRHGRSIRPHGRSQAARSRLSSPNKVLYQRLWKEISWYEGEVYGFPFTALTMYLWYRKDLLEDPKEREGFKAKYGYDLKVPATWKEYSGNRGVVPPAQGQALRDRDPGQAPRGPVVRVAQFPVQLWRRHDEGRDRQPVRPDHRQQPRGGGVPRVLQGPDEILAPRHPQLLLGRPHGPHAAGQGVPGHHVERRDLRRGGPQAEHRVRQDGLRSHSPGQGRQGRPGRGLDLSHSRPTPRTRKPRISSSSG